MNNKTIYKYILEILKEGSFSNAAENLYISQPSLSRAIINYEKKLDTKIFDRSGKTIKLTLEGEKVLVFLHEYEQLENKLYADIRTMKSINNENKNIDIGIISWKVPIFLPKIVPEFKKTYPDIKTTLTINNSVTLENLVANDDLDVAIINGPIRNENLESLELYTSNLVIVANKNISDNYITMGNKNNTYQVINPKDLENENFILLRDYTRLGQITRNILYHNNVTSPTIIDVDNANSAIEMVNVGIGFTFIPEYLAKTGNIDVENINVFTIDKSTYSVPLVIAYKKHKIKNSSINSFIDFVYTNYKR